MVGIEFAPNSGKNQGGEFWLDWLCSWLWVQLIFQRRGQRQATRCAKKMRG